ncbi:MAG: hypothetical protein WDW38_003589 [Sanguina aurantia]
MESRAVSFTAALAALNRVLREKTTSLQNTTDLSQMDLDVPRLNTEMSLAVNILTGGHNNSGGQDWPRLAIPSAVTPGIWRALQTEYTECAGCFGTFLAMSLSTMKQMEAEICAEELTPFTHPPSVLNNHGLYNSLNDFTRNTCYCLSMIWRNYSALFPHDVRRLAAGLTAHLTWLLGTLRQKNHALGLLQRGDQRQGRSWQKQLLMMLGPSLACLRVLRRLPTREMLRAVPTLSPGFVSTLCCLTVELVGSELLLLQPDAGTSAQAPNPLQVQMRDSGTANFLSSLAEVIYHLNTTFDGQGAPPDELACPAVMAVAKLSVMACAVIPSTTPAAASTAHGVLHTMLTHCLLSGPDPSTPSHRRYPRDSTAPGSGGRYGGHDVLPRFEISDTQLLLSVRRYVLQHPQCLDTATHLMWWTITVWTYRRGTGCTDGFRLSQEQVGCLLGLLAHCSLHLKRHMQQRQQQQQQQQPSGQPRLTAIQPLQMTQLYNLKLLAMVMYNETMGVTEESQ